MKKKTKSFSNPNEIPMMRAFFKKKKRKQLWACSLRHVRFCKKKKTCSCVMSGFSTSSNSVVSKGAGAEGSLSVCGLIVFFKKNATNVGKMGMPHTHKHTHTHTLTHTHTAITNVGKIGMFEGLSSCQTGSWVDSEHKKSVLCTRKVSPLVH